MSLIQESTCRRLTICFKSGTNNRFTENKYLQLLTKCFCSLVSINKTQIDCNYSILRIRVYVLFVCRAAIVMAPIPWKKHANKSLYAFSVLHYTLLHSVHCLHKTREFILLAAFSWGLMVSHTPRCRRCCMTLTCSCITAQTAVNPKTIFSG